MAETALTTTTAAGKWSATGAAMVMTAVDNTNGNKFVCPNDGIVIVHNTSGGALSFQMTSQPVSGNAPGAGRTGSVNQSLAAGEIRAFRVTKNGWANVNGDVLIPTGLNVALKVGILVLS